MRPTGRSIPLNSFHQGQIRSSRSISCWQTNAFNQTKQGFENLISRIQRLSLLEPLAISITWGAGGSTKERSLELAGLTQAEYGLDTILHLTCTNMVKGLVDSALKASGFETCSFKFN